MSTFDQNFAYVISQRVHRIELPKRELGGRDPFRRSRLPGRPVIGQPRSAKKAAGWSSRSGMNHKRTHNSSMRPTRQPLLSAPESQKMSRTNTHTINANFLEGHNHPRYLGRNARAFFESDVGGKRVRATSSKSVCSPKFHRRRNHCRPAIKAVKSFHKPPINEPYEPRHTPKRR